MNADPLRLKTAVNLGRWVVEHFVSSGLGAAGGDGASPSTPIDIAVIGAGPAGLSAGLTALSRGLSVVVLEESGSLAPALSRWIETAPARVEPYECRNVSLLPVFAAPQDALLAAWATVLAGARLVVRFKTAVEGIAGGPGRFEMATTRGLMYARRAVLAAGISVRPISTLDLRDHPTFGELDDVSTRRTFPLYVQRCPQGVQHEAQDTEIPTRPVLVRAVQNQSTR